MSHTPWEYYAKLTGSENHRGYSITEGSTRIADVMPIDEDGIKGKEYARRIVACVNALADIPTESIETMHMVSMPRELVEQRDQLAADNATLRAALQTHAEEAAKLMAQRDELLAALTELLCQYEGVYDSVDNDGDRYQSQSAADAEKSARAAITNATNERKTA